jgi:hypothetical protein
MFQTTNQIPTSNINTKYLKKCVWLYDIDKYPLISIHRVFFEDPSDFPSPPGIKEWPAACPLAPARDLWAGQERRLATTWRDGAATLGVI